MKRTNVGTGRIDISRAQRRRRLGITGTAAVALLVLGGCRTLEKPIPDPVQGYTCCNLHYEGNWISDSNYTSLPMVPAGTLTKVSFHARYRAFADINGQPFRLGLDYGREQENMAQWVAKIIVPNDPRVRLATYPQPIQDAIKAGRIMKGMNKEQVVMALGYPLTSENKSLDEPTWRYWANSFDEYQVSWDEQGLVMAIYGLPEILEMVVFKP